MFHILLKVLYECYFQVLRQIAGWRNPHPAAIVVSFLLQDGQGGLPFPRFTAMLSRWIPLFSGKR